MNYRQFGRLGQKPSAIGFGTKKSEGSSADSCIRCGACEEKRPQHIAMCDQLVTVSVLLG